MADLQCVICDYKVPETEAGDELLTLLGAATTADAGQALVEHMGTHTLSDWVRAFKMADLYIAKLEKENAQLQHDLGVALEDAIRMVPTSFQDNPVMVRQQDVGPSPIDPMTLASGAFTDMPASDLARMQRMFTPAEIAARQRIAAVRAAERARNPDESLIPFYKADARPEGVVGRKF